MIVVVELEVEVLVVVLDTIETAILVTSICSPSQLLIIEQVCFFSTFGSFLFCK